MTPERLRQIEELYHSAREREPNERAAFLAQACRGDEELRQELDQLLAPDSSSDNILDSPAANLLANSSVAQLATGTQIGPYKVEAALGAGGMGEVYRARDNELRRDVALKLLPKIFASDAERLARFQREAQALAALNHSNIAQIYGLEGAGTLRCIVMEFVDGDTLNERLKRGPLPVKEALAIAQQITEALEAAHEKGIIHRDLKPANVKITPEGRVKVLDFGLAKPMGKPDHDFSDAPTGATASGVILGTAAYMSPEQARGETVDHRSDIFSFGCVLYEMLTGREAFGGKTVSDVLAAVLTREPDASCLPANLPLKIRTLLLRCLTKDTKQRWQAIGDIRFELEHTDLESTGAETQTRRPTRLVWTWLVIATVIASLFAVPAVRYLRQTSPTEMRVEINTPSTPAPLEFALSPDGRSIVFVASGNGPQQRLWLRALDKTDARPIPGTEGAQRPFWSPDGRSIGFFTFGKLYRVDVIGGRPQVIANAPNAGGGTWNANGTILFAPTSASPIMRTGIGAGEPVAVTRLDPPRQISHQAPQFLPDGRHFLFYTRGTPDSSGIYIGSLDGGLAKRLIDADTVGMYLPGDNIIFERQRVLMAQRVNLGRDELIGDPVIIANPVAYGAGVAQSGFSVSRDGRIAYRADDAGSAKQLVWFDGTGRAMGAASEPVPVTDTQFYAELSPDERRIAISETVQGNMDLWLLEVGRSGKARLTFDPARDQGPIWSPDEKWIAFSSNRRGLFDLYLMKASSGAGTEELLQETPNNKGPLDWSKDGQFLLYVEIDPKTGRDLWVLPMTGEKRKPRVVVNTPFEERNGQFSPDVHWLAYETNESGVFQIVVQAFPEPSGKWQLSTNGGVQPRWRADGKELYFIAPDGKLMSVPVTASGSSFEAGTPVAHFQTRIAGGGAETFRPQYSVSRDARFLINQLVETSMPPITLILNWKRNP
jgi:serine/threonine protein kinase